MRIEGRVVQNTVTEQLNNAISVKSKTSTLKSPTLFADTACFINLCQESTCSDASLWTRGKQRQVPGDLKEYS